MPQAAISFVMLLRKQAELNCAGVDTWQKFQIMLNLFRNSLQTKPAICLQVCTKPNASMWF